MAITNALFLLFFFFAPIASLPGGTSEGDRHKWWNGKLPRPPKGDENKVNVGNVEIQESNKSLWENFEASQLEHTIVAKVTQSGATSFIVFFFNPIFLRFFMSYEFSIRTARYQLLHNEEQDKRNAGYEKPSESFQDFFLIGVFGEDICQKIF